MVVAIHRTTLELKPSADTQTVPEPAWKHNPNLTAVGWTSESVPPTVPFRYWKAPADWNAVGAGPVEMSAGEKAAVDTAALSADRDARIAALLDQVESVLRHVVLLVRDEQNIQADRYNELRAQILAATSLANLQTRVTNNTSDMPVRTLTQLRTAIRNKGSKPTRLWWLATCDIAPR